MIYSNLNLFQAISHPSSPFPPFLTSKNFIQITFLTSLEAETIDRNCEVDHEGSQHKSHFKDESLSTEVPSFKSQTFDSELNTPTPEMKTLKPRRGRQPRENISISCSNFNCTLVKKVGMKWSKVKFPSETSMHYCEDCSKSIKKKWTCHFCKNLYTSPSHSKGADSYEWIKCDSSKCGRWTHIQCE